MGPVRRSVAAINHVSFNLCYHFFGLLCIVAVALEAPSLCAPEDVQISGSWIVEDGEVGK